ncbi:sulfatase [Lentisphaerota bacterium WC36G]|nr:sulfatase [Lentisphaerae bacterium WC36]
MNKIKFFTIVAVSSLSSIAVAQNKPSIILINVDDLGYKDVGFNGSKYYSTPNIDKLVSQGVIFNNGYAGAANCAPSRACLLTGLNTPKHKIFTVNSSSRGKAKNRKIIPVKNNTILSEKFPTMASIFRDAGYKTINIGKFHVGENPLNYGFDCNIAGNHAGHPSSYFSPYKNKNLKDGKKGEHLPYRLTSEAINFIEKSKQQPYFLYLPYYSVHTPLQGKKELIEKYRKIGKIKSEKQLSYAAMIESLDDNIGRLTNYLQQQNLLDKTIIVFTGDNGSVYSFSPQKPLRAGKGTYYEGGIRVPFAIRWPQGKIPANCRLNERVSQLDLLPTLARLANVKLENNKFDGIDVSSYIFNKKNNKEISERAIFFHFPIYLQCTGKALNGISKHMQSRDPLFRTRPGSVIIYNNYKLIKYYEDKNDYELFDLKNDISEQHNLANQKIELKKQLIIKLEEWLKENNAPIPTRKNPKYIAK